MVRTLETQQVSKPNDNPALVEYETVQHEVEYTQKKNKEGLIHPCFFPELSISTLEEDYFLESIELKLHDLFLFKVKEKHHLDFEMLESKSGFLVYWSTGEKSVKGIVVTHDEIEKVIQEGLNKYVREYEDDYR